MRERGRPAGQRRDRAHAIADVLSTWRWRTRSGRAQQLLAPPFHRSHDRLELASVDGVAHGSSRIRPGARKQLVGGDVDPRCADVRGIGENMSNRGRGGKPA